jgi:hypothetical protein
MNTVSVCDENSTTTTHTTTAATTTTTPISCYCVAYLIVVATLVATVECLSELA